jgi:hypothetical protein
MEDKFKNKKRKEAIAKEKLYIPIAPQKHKSYSIGDIVTFNEPAINYIAIGEYNLAGTKDSVEQKRNGFFMVRAYLSKALANLTTHSKTGPKNQFQQAAKEKTYFCETENINSYFLSYDKEIRANFRQEHSMFLSIANTEEAVYKMGHPKPVNFLQVEMANFFNGGKDKKEEIYPAGIFLGNEIFESGGFIMLPDAEYLNSSPTCLRGQICHIWKANKEIDRLDDEGKRKEYNLRRFNPDALKKYKYIETIDSKIVVQTPLNSIIACVEWFGHPTNFMMNIPLYVLTHYSINPQKED